MLILGLKINVLPIAKVFGQFDYRRILINKLSNSKKPTKFFWIFWKGFQDDCYCQDVRMSWSTNGKSSIAGRCAALDPKQHTDKSNIELIGKCGLFHRYNVIVTNFFRKVLKIAHLF